MYTQPGMWNTSPTTRLWLGLALLVPRHVLHAELRLRAQARGNDYVVSAVPSAWSSAA
jgi:hypothetical protein